jgi:uncharacterized protein (TIGR03067 family)
MSYYGSIVMLAGFMTASGLAAPPKGLPEAAKKELKVLSGKWKVVKFVYSDRETTPEAGDGVIVEFKGDRIDFAGATTGVVEAMDHATDPKCLDFKAQGMSGVFKKGSPYESVYKLDGDKLTWAVYVGRGKIRPMSLDKPKEAGVMLMMLERIKE